MELQGVVTNFFCTFPAPEFLLQFPCRNPPLYRKNHEISMVDYREIINHKFETLQSRYTATVARALPILIWEDTIDSQLSQIHNLHEDFCSIYIIRNGRGTHVIDDMEYAISRGDVYAMGPGMVHHFGRGDHLQADTIHFQPTIFDEETLAALAHMPGFHSLTISDQFAADMPPPTVQDELNERRWLHLTPTQYAAVQVSMTELFSEWRNGSDVSVLLTRSLFLRLLVQLTRFHSENIGVISRVAPTRSLTFSGLHEATIAAALQYMEEHFRESIRIEQVAATVFLSPDRFTEVFAKAMGRTPRDYLRHLRVEEAKMLLVTTDLSMARVASASGFGEAAYFTRVIRTATGLTPTAYRKLKRQSK